VVDDWRTWPFSALLVGTYVNSILYTLEILAVVRYYSTSKHNHDSGLFQAMIYFTFLLDTVCTISTYACVYLVCKSSSSFRSNLMNLYFIYSTPSLIGVWFFIALFYWPISMSNSVTGDVNYLQNQYWPFDAFCITTGISAAIVQSFLIYRYWKLSVFCFHLEICCSNHTLSHS
jgi:hypothetical protein